MIRRCFRWLRRLWRRYVQGKKLVGSYAEINGKTYLIDDTPDECTMTLLEEE